MKKEDMRTRRTKKALKTAVITLLENETIENISVTDICKAAEINRVTFYTHYKDKYELIKDQLKDIIFYIEQQNKQYYEKHRTGDIIKDITHTVSHSVYKTCVVNKKIVKALIKEENLLFFKIMEEFIVEQGMRTLDHLEAKGLLKFPPKLIIYFIIGGFSKIVYEFTLNENSLSEHEFFLYFDKLFYSLLDKDIFIDHKK